MEAATRSVVTFLKSLFDQDILAKNLLIVVTNVSQSKPALKQRQASGKSVAQLLDDTGTRISAAFGLSDKLPCFDIDTAPVRHGIMVLAFALQLQLGLLLPARKATLCDTLTVGCFSLDASLFAAALDGAVCCRVCWTQHSIRGLGGELFCRPSWHVLLSM